MDGRTAYKRFGVSEGHGEVQHGIASRLAGVSGHTENTNVTRYHHGHRVPVFASGIACRADQPGLKLFLGETCEITQWWAILVVREIIFKKSVANA